MTPRTTAPPEGIPTELAMQREHAALVEYLLVKVEARDWHGVSDAANDLRVLEERMRCLTGRTEP